MLARFLSKIPGGNTPPLIKYCNGTDASKKNAFPSDATVTFSLDIPRVSGIAAVVMRIHRDGEDSRDLPFSYAGAENSLSDSYRLSLSAEKLCFPEKQGLFYYELLFIRGNDTLFSSSKNNEDYAFSLHSGNLFRLTFYREDGKTPRWFFGKTMYHIFIDRFCRGNGPVRMSEEAVLDGDWENGIPPYAKKAGDPLSNTTFFGGNLWGIIEKIPYLKSLGVDVLYLSPLFRARSNHKYDTGDYETVDGMFGGEEAFRELLKKTRENGLDLILDGVFNHTGDDSRYFNKYGSYPSLGAYQSKESPFFDWYSFKDYPEEYACWWGIPILPKLNHQKEDCRKYFTGPDGIGARYIGQGIAGWRLDVADELSDEFLDEFYQSVKKKGDRKNPPLILGEVWENASDKVAYGKRRRYFQGGQLDSVMNYPFRSAVLRFLKTGDAEFLGNTLTELYSSYPEPVCHGLMNILGTHDTERILTLLGEDDDRYQGMSNDELAVRRLSKEALEKAKALLILGSVLQFTVFGVPSIYYGDEAGMEGFHDPFCRRPFPWNRIDPELLSHYRNLGQMRKREKALSDGSFRVLRQSAGVFAFERRSGDELLVTTVNLSSHAVRLTKGERARDAYMGEPLDEHFSWTLEPNRFSIITYTN